MRIRSLLKEPLLHFLLLGLLLFLLYGKVAPTSADGNRITVNRAVISGLATQFQATWSRPPTTLELNGLVDSYVRDEILFREGVALGLVKDDPVIKRRVRQKLEVLIEEEGKGGASDAELSAYLSRNSAKFQVPPVLSFEQVLFDPARYGDQLESAVKASMTALKNGATPESQGRGSMLPARVEKLPLDLVVRDFGDEFGKALETATVGQWIGPVSSGFGVHLLHVSERKPGYVPSLDEARKAVTREWENDQRVAALASNYARLRKDYDVVIEADSTGAPVR